MTAWNALELEAALEEAPTIGARLDIAHAAMAALGLGALIYDYAPVAYTHEGELITPSFFGMREVPDDMVDLWSSSGFYQIDPVQHLALNSPRPFVWSYRRNGQTVLNRALDERHEPVVTYVHDMAITCGMTVPIHGRSGDCATVTGIRYGAEDDFHREGAELLGDFTLLAHAVHAAVEPLFGEAERRSRAVHLTPRERECLRFSAEGLSAKDISGRLSRSVPTVTMHLNAAARKLGARNRAQMIARAAHYRLL
ncbi:LuxR family transcriptional regulator [Aureimonas phyllosphaerae]|uniref:LuxR family transcriptional regulator n=1 Tax=Aureimonas phyllosphaerae TaxID=1166078 RepID=A0A7W6FX15_9HYPH|nr:LuxR family transcriptional regulator [Aureimonas phyllosphaerae]MBB3937607.1 LuxR family transcriptional regulator [Aureimonas phyllosphaerae]MBB3961593.1 LuxR family transcriptional regulator [Aureimonas phyllosphaerae]SFF46782.1 LuxR family transcriptional regulator [Aureimonas phyllosphaerae]